jgi:ADP-ribose pyrophosphatase YjhB (NUDIX family)
MSEFFCKKGCCNYKVTKYIKPYKHKVFNNIDKKRKKAGIFLYDPFKRKILLVQSCGKLWGPPKGSLEPGEDNETCAKRELREETGIIIDELSLNNGNYIKNNAYYYYLEFPEREIYVQNQKKNDANGVGWFGIDCIIELIKNNKLMVNQHCRIGLKKFFDIDVFKVIPSIPSL